MESFLKSLRIQATSELVMISDPHGSHTTCQKPLSDAGRSSSSRHRVRKRRSRSTATRQQSPQQQHWQRTPNRRPAVARSSSFEEHFPQCSVSNASKPQRRSSFERREEWPVSTNAAQPLRRASFELHNDSPKTLDLPDASHLIVPKGTHITQQQQLRTQASINQVTLLEEALEGLSFGEALCQQGDSNAYKSNILMIPTLIDDWHVASS